MLAERRLAGAVRASRASTALDDLRSALAQVRCDTYLDDDELAVLSAWLRRSAEAAGDWRLRVLRRRLRTILRDGMLLRGEAAHLGEVVARLTQPEEVELALPDSLRAGAVCFAGRRFCFAGGFLYGARELCEGAVKGRGGLTVRSVSPALDYLVAGTFPGGCGASARAGKLVRALTLAKSGARLRILSEREWIDALDGAAVPAPCGYAGLAGSDAGRGESER